MNNAKLKKYVENKIKLLQLNVEGNTEKFEDLDEAYETGFEDGEIKGVYDALMMVHVLMGNKDD